MKTLLAEKVLKGDVRATAQLIRRIDDGDRDVFDDLAVLYKHSGKAHIIGFTGPRSRKIHACGQNRHEIPRRWQNGRGISHRSHQPFTGGAILGDRIRMQKHFLDEGVFIRSMATRGKFGGLTRSTADAIVVLDAMGKDVIVVETVGVGQDEVRYSEQRAHHGPCHHSRHG